MPRVVALSAEEVRFMMNTATKPMRKIAVRKAGPVRLTTEAAALYSGPCRISLPL